MAEEPLQRGAMMRPGRDTLADCRSDEPFSPEQLPQALSDARRFAQEAFRRAEYGPCWLLVAEAACVARCGRDKILGLVKSGTLTSRWKVKTGERGTILIDLASFETWLEKVFKAHPET